MNVWQLETHKKLHICHKIQKRSEIHSTWQRRGRCKFVKGDLDSGWGVYFALPWKDAATDTDSLWFAAKLQSERAGVRVGGISSLQRERPGGVAMESIERVNDCLHTLCSCHYPPVNDYTTSTSENENNINWFLNYIYLKRIGNSFILSPNAYDMKAKCSSQDLTVFAKRKKSRTLSSFKSRKNICMSVIGHSRSHDCRDLKKQHRRFASLWCPPLFGKLETDCNVAEECWREK